MLRMTLIFNYQATSKSKMWLDPVHSVYCQPVLACLLLFSQKNTSQSALICDQPIVWHMYWFPPVGGMNLIDDAVLKWKRCLVIFCLINRPKSIMVQHNMDNKILTLSTQWLLWVNWCFSYIPLLTTEGLHSGLKCTVKFHASCRLWHCYDDKLSTERQKTQILPLW